MLAEEAFHWDFAEGRVAELAGLPGGSRQLQARVDASLPELLCWFGRPGEPGVEALVAQGVLGQDNRRLRRRYLERVGPVLDAAGIVRGRLADEELPWERWNPLHRRLEPAPAAPEVRCPWCGSGQVEQVAMVGPTVLTSSWICGACHTPFERIRRR